MLLFRFATLVEFGSADARDRLFLVFEYDDGAFLRTTLLLADPTAEFTEVRRTLSTKSVIGAPQP
jgi:hypothetical protein